jgi:hypothetical protein
VRRGVEFWVDLGEMWWRVACAEKASRPFVTRKHFARRHIRGVAVAAWPRHAREAEAARGDTQRVASLGKRAFTARVTTPLGVGFLDRECCRVRIRITRT